MSLKIPISRYRPTRVSDSEGGWTETLGTALTIYGAIRLHENKTMLACDRHEDVRDGDILVAEQGSYRVMSVERVMGTRLTAYSVEKIDRPIVP